MLSINQNLLLSVFVFFFYQIHPYKNPNLINPISKMSSPWQNNVCRERKILNPLNTIIFLPKLFIFCQSTYFYSIYSFCSFFLDPVTFCLQFLWSTAQLNSSTVSNCLQFFWSTVSKRLKFIKLNTRILVCSWLCLCLKDYSRKIRT